MIGIISFSKGDMERLAKAKEKLDISVIGMLSFDTDISEELFKNTVERIIIRGKLIASDEIKRIIEDME